MIVSDIYEEVRELTGSAKEALNFRAITRAIEVLANKKLCDPLMGYLDFYVSGGYSIALPRECKAPIRVNINDNPSFPRSRLFEFTMNTAGSVEGEEVGWNWSDRLIVPVQDETKFPGKVAYTCDNSADVGKTAKIKGRDIDGIERTEVIVAAQAAPVESVYDYVSLTSVRRDATIGECFFSVNDISIARYDPDETFPSYRAIKLSKTGVAVRILFRRHSFAIKAMDDEVPVSSTMAVLQGLKAVRLMAEEKWDEAEKAITKAKEFLEDEQATLEMASDLSETLDAKTATDTNISTRDGFIVGDIYDDASEIFGPVGRGKVFDKITLAIEALINKGQWQSSIGMVDIWKSENVTEVNSSGRKGNGIFVLPRDVETILQLNLNGQPQRPKNGWHEFHLNGLGERSTSSFRSWHDEGEVVTINRLPRDATTHRTIPAYVVAVPDTALDNGTQVRIYGTEELADGTQVEVYRDGTVGWTCPCTYGSYNPGNNAPKFVEITRIAKSSSRAFIRLVIAERAASAAIAEIENPTAGLFEADYLSSLVNFALGDEFTTPSTGSQIFIVTEISAMVPMELDQITYEPASIFVAAELAYRLSETFTAGLILGYWHPDEVEPKYRAIKVSTTRETRIRIKFKRRWRRVNSMFDWIPLRSRLALLDMMRSLEAKKTDPQSAIGYELAATNYLKEEQRANSPHNQGSIQIDEDTAPFSFTPLM